MLAMSTVSSRPVPCVYIYHCHTLCLHQSLPEEMVQEVSEALKKGEAPPTVFSVVKEHLYQQLHDMHMKEFSKR